MSTEERPTADERPSADERPRADKRASAGAGHDEAPQTAAPLSRHPWLLASENPGKAREFEAGLRLHGVRLSLARAAGVPPFPEEMVFQDAGESVLHLSRHPR